MNGIRANLDSVAKPRLLIPTMIPVALLVVAGVEIRATLLLLRVKLLGMTVAMEVGRYMPQHRLLQKTVLIGVSRACDGKRRSRWT